ncbi:hypothetical protein [Zavarzinia sp.]|uniref:hypothetical protein n=1 Tax=Zavarzinia sp. TaxID=2027920 RepID=UPI003566ED91
MLDSVPNSGPDSGLQTFRALIAERDRREGRSARLTLGGVLGLWALYLFGVVEAFGAQTGLGAFLGFTGLAAALLPVSLLTFGLLIGRGWLARRAGLDVLGPRRSPLRDTFEPLLPQIEGLVDDAGRLPFEAEERRRLDGQFDRLAGVLTALGRIGPLGDREQARILATGVAPILRDMAEVRRRALARSIASGLPPGTTAGRLAGERVPPAVAPALARLEELLASAGRSELPATVAAARRAQSSADRALAALAADPSLAGRTAGLLSGLADELADVLARQAASAGPAAVLEVEERLFRQRADGKPPTA